MSSLRENIEFQTLDGTTLRGFFYKARQNGSQPCIIMTPGLGALKEQFLPDFAERFQEAGYGVIIYDHRNFGASDGLPRYECDPIQQARDYSDAFDFAASLKDVDKSKIVYWGSSMSGGVVMHAAAFDKRIRAAVAQVPFVSGTALEGLFSKYVSAIHEDRQCIKAGNAPGLVQVFAENSKDAKDPHNSALTQDPALIPFIEELERRNIQWGGAITLQSLHNLAGCEPLNIIHKIAPNPLLIVTADRDQTSAASLQLKAYAAALEPKKLVILRDTDHFMPYIGPSFEKNITAQLGFLEEVFGGDK
ncbi:hypothetical protein EAE96_000467 [Botrytis aclada]|nr:hypothetical protein EAE96_000467 [Botrytis aclada]